MNEKRPANDAERFLRLAQRGERGQLTVYLIQRAGKADMRIEPPT